MKKFWEEWESHHLKQLKKRRNNLIGHIFRHKSLLANNLEDSVEVKNYKGRSRADYKGQLVEVLGCQSYVELKIMAQLLL